MKLTAGNSDLYHHGEDADASIPAVKKLAELKVADSTVTKEDFQYDLVFFYRYENRDTDVAPWLTAKESLASIGDASFTGSEGSAESWLAGEGRSFSVTEWNADGTAISRELTLKDGSKMTLNNIQPRHVEMKTDGSDAGNYFELDKAGGVHRGEEFYKILYTVTDGTEVYVVSREVKLRYKAGDANLDGSINIQDAGYANQYSINLAFPFRDAEGNDIPALSLSVLDLNEDKSGNIQDAGYMNQLSINLIAYPYCRY